MLNQKDINVVVEFLADLIAGGLEDHEIAEISKECYRP